MCIPRVKTFVRIPHAEKKMRTGVTPSLSSRSCIRYRYLHLRKTRSACKGLSAYTQFSLSPLSLSRWTNESSKERAKVSDEEKRGKTGLGRRSVPACLPAYLSDAHGKRAGSAMRTLAIPASHYSHPGARRNLRTLAHSKKNP